MGWRSRLQILPAIIIMMAPIPAATIEGTVTDASGRPLENARIDHVGKVVFVPLTSVSVKQSPDETRTDATGHFLVTTRTPVFVVRKPGFLSERVRLNGDTQYKIVLTPIASTSRCRLSPPPAFKTKVANDVDYSATLYYIKTKTGKQGIISGSGATYSFGAPNENDVRTSAEYSEFMLESGVIDAAGHSADGKYWRSKSVFGSAAQYFNQTRENAEKLDCVMDRVSLNPQ